MRAKEFPSKEKLNMLFEYRDGALYRKIRVSRSTKIGDKINGMSGNGYRKTQIFGQCCLVHRVVYKMHHGGCPENIDHINGNRSDNRINNLRPATTVQNGGNRKKQKNTTSQYKGVSWCQRLQSWKSGIYPGNKLKHLGYFSVEKEAAKAYDRAALKYFGEYAKLNLLTHDNKTSLLRQPDQ